MPIGLDLEPFAYWAAVGSSFFPGVAFLACALATLRRESRRGAMGEMSIARFLDAAGLQHIDDFFIRRGDGDLTQIDHAVLFPGGIAVIETKDWRGNYYYGPDPWEDSWRLTEDGEAIREIDSNPFQQNEWHADSVRELVGDDVPVWNIVCMAHPEGGAYIEPTNREDEPPILRQMRELERDIEMPFEGWPGLFNEDEIAVRLSVLTHREAVAGVDEAWRVLRSAALTDRATREEHAKAMEGDETPSGRLQAFLLLLATGIGLGAVAAAFWAFQWGLFDRYIPL